MEAENIGALQIEFLINNPEILAELEKTEAAYDSTVVHIEQSAGKAGAAIAKLTSDVGFSVEIAGGDTVNASLSGISQNSNAATTGVAELQAELLNLQNAQAQIVEGYQAGTVSAELYAEAIKILSTKERELISGLAQFDVVQAESTTIQAQAGAVAEETTVAYQEQIGVLQRLGIELEILKARQPHLIDPAEIEATNLAIQQTEAKIIQFTNVGKAGYDAYGQKIKASTVATKQAVVATNEVAQATEGAAIKSGKFQTAIAKVSSLSNLGATVVSRLYRQVVGLGVGFLSFGIGAKMIEGLISWFEKLDFFTGRLNQMKQNIAALKEVMANADKDAGQQIGSLKELYDAATNVNKSMDERIAAAQQLREQDAATFANASALSIVNGDLKKSYDALTLSIIAQAKSSAASSKIMALEGEKLDAKFQIDQNNNLKAQQKAQAAIDYQNNRKNPNQSFMAQALQKQSANPTLNIVTPGVSINSALELYNAEIAAINEATNRLNLKPAQDLSVKTGVETFLEKYVLAIGKKGEDLKKANEYLGKDLSNFDNLVSKITDKKDVDVLQENLKIKLDSLAPNDAQRADIEKKLRQVEALEKLYAPKINDGKAAAAAAAEALKEKTGLLQQFDEIQATYRKKDMTEDEAAMQAIADRYNKLRQKFIEFNASAKGKLSPVSQGTISRVDQAQVVDEDNQSVLNSNKKLEQDIELKKKMYGDYEAYRLKVGSETADAQYNDLLKSGKDFGDYLNNIYKSTDNIQKGYVGDVSGSVDKLREFINKQQAANAETQKQQLNALLEQYASYEQQKAAIIAKGTQDEALLRTKGHNQEADQVHKETQDKLDTLTEEHVKSLDAWKLLFDSSAHLTETKAKASLAIIKDALDKALKAGDITQTLYDAILKKADAAYKGITNGLSADKLKAVGSALQQWSSDISNFNKGLGDALGMAGKMVSAFGSIKTDLNTLGDSNASSLEKMGAGLGIIGSVLGVITSGLTAIAETNAQQQAYTSSLQIKSIEAVNKALERQLALTKQIYGPERVSGYLSSLAKIKLTYDDEFTSLQNKMQLTGNKVVDDDIARVNNGLKAVNLITYYEAQRSGQLITLAGKNLEDLIQLMDSGKLDSATAAIVQSLVALQQQAIDTQNALNEEFTGQSFDSLTSGIMQLLQDSTTGVEQWGDNFQKIVQQSILKGFETKYLETQLQAFYNDLANFTKADGGVLSKASIAKLQDEYNTIIKNAQTQIAQVQQATGVTLTNPTGTGSTATPGLAGAIKGITEEQAGVLEGAVRGIQAGVVKGNDQGEARNDTMKSQLAEMRAQTLIQKQIEANTRRTADNTDVLPGMSDSLKAIDQNTKDTTGAVLRAAGIK